MAAILLSDYLNMRLIIHPTCMQHLCSPLFECSFVQLPLICVLHHFVVHLPILLMGTFQLDRVELLDLLNDCFIFLSFLLGPEQRRRFFLLFDSLLNQHLNLIKEHDALSFLRHSDIQYERSIGCRAGLIEMLAIGWDLVEFSVGALDFELVLQLLVLVTELVIVKLTS